VGKVRLLGISYGLGKNYGDGIVYETGRNRAGLKEGK
jgi:hypothetical protein